MTQAFRRWDAPRVKVGGLQLTPAGLVRFDAVSRVRDPSPPHRERRAEGRRQGPRHAPEVPRPEGRASRRHAVAVAGTRSIASGSAGPARTRGSPCATASPTTRRLRDIATRLGRLDARPTGPWTREILEWIRDNPRVVSKELAALRGVELLPMKVDIRKLKALGLTISHDVGYELSPRGTAYLDWLQRDDG